MTKREATQIAHGIAYRTLEKAIGVGGDEGCGNHDDQIKIERALDAIAQRHFELAGPHAGDKA